MAISISTQQLASIMPKLPSTLVDAYLPLLNVTLNTYEINTPLRASAFLAQLAHESRELTRLKESFSYTAERLVEVFPRHFQSVDIAAQYVGKPQDIANRVYSNKNGNGDISTGDGWTYRGRGFIQLTGKGNYSSMSKRLGHNLLEQPDLAAQPNIAFFIAGEFWKTRKLNDLADKRRFTTITKLINGGTNGLKERLDYYAKALKVLGT